MTPSYPKPLDLVVTCRDRRECLDRLEESADDVVLFVPADERARAGTPVTLQLLFRDERQPFQLEGTVVWWRSHGVSSDATRGIGVRLAEDDRGSLARLVAFVHETGERPDHRRHPRIPVHGRVLFRGPGFWGIGRMGDIGREGLFVNSERIPDQGTPVSTVFRIPGRLLPLRLKGRVSWCHRDGDSIEPSGFGIEFLFRDEREQALVETFCRSAGEQFLDSFLD